MDLTQLIEHPEQMDKETLYDLRNLVAQYPYFQTARLLLLQNLYLLHDSSFDEELRRAAVYVSDRKVLFRLIEAAHYRLKVQEKPQQVTKEEKESRTVALIDSFLDSIPDDRDKEEKSNKRKPTPADAAVDYVSYLLEVESEEEKRAAGDMPQMKGQELIDDFISKDGGKIELKETPEYIPESEAEDSENDADSGFFTETLAQIYIKQGKYDKALEIIKRLNLIYPKKNRYFADQIRFLEKLIINNKK